ncbi:MAG: DUF4091 domain-containing protein [Armatimonadetes bacterium]|nr:DUF4091 domain-containing protein [Armatimonadota bacterium]
MFRVLRYACLFTLLVSVAIAAPIDTLILCDFENASDVDRFFVRTTNPPSSFVANADGTASIFFPKWQQGSEEWPAVIYANDKGMPQVWSDYDYALCDVRNVGTKDCTVSLYIRDPDGEHYSVSGVIKPGELKQLRMDFEVAPSKLDFKRISEFHVNATRPPDDMSLVIDNIRLESNVMPRLEKIAEAIQKLRSESREYASEIDPLLNHYSSQHRLLINRVSQATNAAALGAIKPDVIALHDQVNREAARAIPEARMRVAARKLDPDAKFACGFASSMVKIFPKDVAFECSVAREATVELAGNEVESVQLLIYAFGQDLNGASVSVGTLTKNGKPGPTVEASPVGFVETKKPPYPVRYIGWHPDPILDFLKGYNIKKGEVQPIWIRVTTPAGVAAGDYTAPITVKANGVQPTQLTLKVRVWDFDVPKESHLRTAMSLYDNFLPNAYGKGRVSQTMQERYEDFVLSYRINPDNIYRSGMPSIESLQRWDKKGLNAFNILYVQRPDGIKKGEPYPAERKAELLKKIDESVALLKANGFYDKAYVYGFDEIGPESFAAMQDIFSEIKARHPDLLTTTTGYDDTYGVASQVDAIDGWIPLTPKYDLKRVAEARARGKQVWWYTCIGPQAPWANWLIEYDLIDARSLMGLQTAKFRPDGYLYYAMMRWPLTRKPITFGPYTDWPAASFHDANGDGSIICAGPHGPLPTIRLENIRDGLEDFEYFWLLEQEINRLKKLSGPAAAGALDKAQRAMIIGDDLVESTRSFSKSPQALSEKRRQVAEAILAARKVRK